MDLPSLLFGLTFGWGGRSRRKDRGGGSGLVSIVQLLRIVASRVGNVFSGYMAIGKGASDTSLIIGNKLFEAILTG